MSYQFLSTTRDGPVEYLTLNRPDVRNAFNEEVIAELADWAARITRDAGADGVRVVVLAGAGKTFCAGADVAWMAKTVAYTEAENMNDAMAASRMFAALDALPVPLIGRVHGAAIGGGAGLCAVCDIVVAEEDAVFGFTEVKLGILPAVISPFALAKDRAVGGARAVSDRGAGSPPQERTRSGSSTPWCRRPSSTRRCRSTCRRSSRQRPKPSRPPRRSSPASGHGLLTAMTVTATAIATRRVSPEGQEGLKAFLEKRKPGWIR